MPLSLIRNNPLILVADDDKSTRIVLKLILHKEKYRIIETATGLDCLKKYQENRPDMVLLDAVMPIMDGFTCCQRLIEIQMQEAKLPNFYQVPILMITGLNDQESVNKAFEAGAVDYITKPIHPPVLRRRLRHLLEVKWAEKALRESEQKYRLVLNNLREVIFQLDPKGKLTFLNSAWQNIMGLSIEESLDKPLTNFIHPEDILTYQSALNSLLSQQKSEFCLSLRYLKPNKNIGWMEIEARPIISENNSHSQPTQIISISGSINDITEQKLRQTYQKVDYEINKVLADKHKINKAITIILSILCKNLGWNLGEYWSLKTNNNLLKLNTAWHIFSDEFKEFIDFSSQITFEVGEGLPGKVWEHNSILWLDDIIHDSNLTRTELINKTNLNTALGFLIASGTEKLGVICLFCNEKKQIDSDFLNLARTLGNQIGQFIKRQKAEAELQRQHLILQSELNQAAQYVSSLLPNSDSIKTIGIKQLFIPSIQLGGDIFDYYWLDSENFVMYLLDVAGHGVRPALLSISILNLLRSQSLYNTDFYQPWTVVKELNRMFPMDDRGENYFTIWYGVYNTTERMLTYCSAAHPPALLFIPNSQGFTVQQLANDNIPVGMLSEFEFEEASCSVPVDSSLYLFSDGVYEIPLDADKFWEFQAFIDYIQTHHSQGRDDLNSILDYVKQLNSGETLSDDFSLIQFKFL